MTITLRSLWMVGAGAAILAIALLLKSGHASGVTESMSVEQQAAEAVAGSDGCLKSFRAMINLDNISATPDRPGLSNEGVFVGGAEEVPKAWGGTLLGRDAGGLWIIRGSGDETSALHIVGFELASGHTAWVIAGGMSRGDCKIWQGPAS